jgi:hypothetical protein
MTIQTDADTAKRKQYIAVLMNIATLFSDLDVVSTSEGKYIINKKWVINPVTDADVESYGFLAVDVANFFTLMTQFTRLMSNQTTTPLEGRKFADMLRSR